ncbi:FAD:protein FMN transferase [Anaerosacchariphilus polymeriproducens]|uniref:FAD:protein FMN transferase n=1 Tax=Anaerosacchariphilus polymeriproducens TaxID=1812858 RepID=A0A371AU73_9FIRM|nr:FAD:protein FMN transferase [Anaerosacchariphilus polymeriproducens]RDU23115.1 FAD:protein FMN transferase [Anaerosacchariphilus polymeriproducens]
MNRKKTIILFIICTLLCGCSANKSNPISKSGLAFDTFITITLYDTKDEKLLDECFNLCEFYENLFSRTLPSSEIAKINAGSKNSFTVSNETAEAIRMGLKYGDISNGLFDITIGSVSELWNFKTETPVLPDDTLLKKALSSINYKNLEVDDNTVILKDSNIKIDLGGIAKGYIADKLKDYLTSKGVKQGIISLGGNILTIGKKPNGSDFTIGIQKPFAKQNQTIASIKISDKSVVSSGIYERYFKMNNKIYHHILNPHTGYPFENNLYEVSIISENSVDGDALSTICFSLGLEKGMELIESIEDTEAIFITDDYSLHYTSGIGKDVILIK